jgi:hypothetical protein
VFDRAARRTPRIEVLDEIPEALWREALENSWKATGNRHLRRIEAASVNGRLELARDLLAVFKRHEHESGPVPWPYGKLRDRIRKRAEHDRALKATNADRWKGIERSRGGESRLAHFVRYLLERHPNLPRTPGPWMRACDKYGSPEPNWVPRERRATWSPDERAEWHRKRRDLWKPLLRRSARESI